MGQTRQSESVCDVAKPDGAALRWFGVPSFTDGHGRATSFRPERPFQLLAYLAYRRTWVTRDELATLLWPDREPEAARANLRKVLLLAQRIDGLEPLELRDDELRWRPDSDLARLDDAALAGRHAEVIALYRPSLMYGLEESLPPGADA